MKIPQFPVCLCALVLGAGLTVHADDTPAQAAARAALMQKLQSLQSGATSAPQTPPPAQTVPAATIAPAAAPVVTFTPAAVSAAPTAVTAAPAVVSEGDTPAQAAARAALMQKLQTLQAGSAAAPATVTVQTTPAARSAPAAQITPAAQVAAPAPIVLSNGNSLSVQQAARVDEPLAVPAPPISMTKEQKLAQLLQLYQADKISPEQYHQQRAAIVAGQ